MAPGLPVQSLLAMAVVAALSPPADDGSRRRFLREPKSPEQVRASEHKKSLRKIAKASRKRNRGR